MDFSRNVLRYLVIRYGNCFETSFEQRAIDDVQHDENNALNQNRKNIVRRKYYVDCYRI